MKPMSLRAYAAHRKRRGLNGGSLQAVQRAIESGRVKKAVAVVDTLPRITDAALADREWAANTDETRRQSKTPLVAIPLDTAPAPADGAGTGDSNEGSFAYWKAKKMELDYRKAAGELVNAAEMQAEIADTFSMLRTKLMGLPSKMKQKLPDIGAPALAAIDATVREALEELGAPAAGEPKEGAA